MVDIPQLSGQSAQPGEGLPLRQAEPAGDVPRVGCQAIRMRPACRYGVCPAETSDRIKEQYNFVDNYQE